MDNANLHEMSQVSEERRVALAFDEAAALGRMGELGDAPHRVVDRAVQPFIQVSSIFPR